MLTFEDLSDLIEGDPCPSCAGSGAAEESDGFCPSCDGNGTAFHAMKVFADRADHYMQEVLSLLWEEKPKEAIARAKEFLQ